MPDFQLQKYAIITLQFYSNARLESCGSIIVILNFYNNNTIALQYFNATYWNIILKCYSKKEITTVTL